MTRLRLIALSLLLPLLLGMALPNVAIWRCAHASRFILAASEMPTVMPCRMAGPMRGMACCNRPQVHTSGMSKATFQLPPCKPILSKSFALPDARIASVSPTLILNSSLLDYALPAAPSPLLTISFATKNSLRGPPGDALSPRHRSPSVGFRAPPIA